MDIRKWVQDATVCGYKSLTSGLGVAGAGVGYVTDFVGNLRLFGSTKTVVAGDQSHDERHYFLIPDPRSEDRYSLAVTRCLPDGVPPVNDLPKLRVLHLPNENAEAMLRSILVKQAQIEELAKPPSGKPLSERAGELADQIDAVDGRVFGGVLLIGGLVAIFNPLVGAAIAAKSLVPSIGLLLSKYGLRAAEESLSQADVNRRIKQAEKDVLSQFRGSKAIQQVCPLLMILDTAINTDDRFDPVLALHEYLQSEISEVARRSMQLSTAAIMDVYDELLKKPRVAHKLGVRAEDIRLLKLLSSIQKDGTKYLGHE